MTTKAAKEAAAKAAAAESEPATLTEQVNETHRKGDLHALAAEAVAAQASAKPGSPAEAEATQARLAAEQALIAKGVRPEDVVPALSGTTDVDPLADYAAPDKIEDGVQWLAPVDDRGRMLVDTHTGHPLT